MTESSHETPRTGCIKPGCTNSFPDHMWGRILEAGNWFISRDETKIYCPEHLPSWVGPWREKKGIISTPDPVEEEATTEDEDSTETEEEPTDG